MHADPVTCRMYGHRQGRESLLAEIHGKISSEGSNLSERLTANVFGTSRYLPFHKGIKPILSKAVFFFSNRSNGVHKWFGDAKRRVYRG